MGNKKKSSTVFKSEKSRKITQRRRNPISRHYKFNILSIGSQGKYKYVGPPAIQFIKAPKQFSMTINIAEMIRFFYNLEKMIKSGRQIYLDMATINLIHEDAILYLISRLDYFQIEHPHGSIQGNLPINPNCRSLLLQSGFLKYVNTQMNPDINDDNIFPIHEGNSADGKIVSQVIDFVKRFIDFGEYAERFYGPIMECIINTGAHAYNKNADYSKWWMIAIPDEPRKKVHFTVLDNGFGIPNTVRKNYSEKIEKQFGKLKFMNTIIDNKLIVSGLVGELRTRTGLTHRGKGLPSIFDLTTIPHIANLRIISSHGHVLTGSNGTIVNSSNLKDKFHGTLISWDFRTAEDGNE